MLMLERAIGDYTKVKPTKYQVSNEERQHLILLIEQMCTCKNYKYETFYQAVSLADRYLEYVSRERL